MAAVLIAHFLATTSQVSSPHRGASWGSGECVLFFQRMQVSIFVFHLASKVFVARLSSKILEYSCHLWESDLA